ncbi:unnamed protein product [Trichobilharzia regenti]|nr:unnamed protein product [Trichobilharzia regenti]
MSPSGVTKASQIKYNNSLELSIVAAKVGKFSGWTASLVCL